MSTVVWTDVAPRDGLQNISDAVSTEAKVRLIRGLLDAGVPRVEATAFVSPKWVPQMGDAAAVLAAFSAAEKAKFRVLIPNKRGLELALEHGISNVLFTIGATDSFNQRNVNRSVEASAQELSELGRDAAAAGCAVDVAISVAFGCPFDGPVDAGAVIALAKRLATIDSVAEVGIADTIGVATPKAVREMVALASNAIDPSRLSFHFHDTRGMGVANVMTAYEGGIRHFDGSAAGVGGCPFAPRSTGNVCSEDALSALASLGADIGADLAGYCAASSQLATDLGHDLPGKLYRAGLWPQ